MNAALLAHLSPISEEEQELLAGGSLAKERYSSSDRGYTFDSQKLMRRGQLIDIRIHTRFVDFPKHAHNFVEFMYMCQGSTRHRINGQISLTLEAGDLLLFSPGCSHSIEAAGEQDLAVNFMVQPAFFHTAFELMEGENVLSDFILDSLTGKNARTQYLHFRAAHLLPVQNLLENLIWSLGGNGKPDSRINQLTMGLLFLHLLQEGTAAENGVFLSYRRQIALRALQYLDEHYVDATLTEFAASEHMPVPQLSRLIKTELGSSFRDLLAAHRFSEAEKLLQRTNLPVTDIIAAVGYANSSYFYRRFYEKRGCTPQQFRLGSSCN